MQWRGNESSTEPMATETLKPLFRLSEATSLAESFDRFARVVSPSFGLVTRVAEMARFSDEPHLHYFFAEVAGRYRAARDGVTCLAKVEPGAPDNVRGGGRNAERDRAMAAAIGEAVERYSAGFVSSDRLVFGAHADLAARAIHPEELMFYAPEQLANPEFRYVQLDATMPISWVAGVALPDHVEVLAPAQLVFYDSREFFEFAPAEPALAQVTSNGLACALTATEAALGALLELLERDAVMIAWYNRLSLPLFDWRSDAECAEFHDRLIAQSRLAVTAVDLSAFHRFPIILSIVRGAAGRWAPTSVAGAAARRCSAAWQKGLTEAVHTFGWLRDVDDELIDRMMNAGPSDVHNFHDRVAYYAHESHGQHAAFLDESDAMGPVGGEMHALPESPGELLEFLTTTLAERGIATYFFDVTAPDVADAGLTVIRALAPALVPLNAGEGSVFLGVPRLRSEPQRLGFGERPLNPYPHPYP
jgi:ribosomal protein S12 methylthiotransferase accessory factor